MNSSKLLLGLFCFLILLVLVTAININYSESRRNDHKPMDHEMLMTNICCVPEIIRSYEKVKNIYGIKNILFLRYVNNTCSNCLDNQMNELLTLQEKIGKDHIWIFPAYPNDRNSRIRLSNELAKYNYKNIPTDSLLIPTYDGELKSYFAFVNDEGEIDMVFVPDRNNVQYTRNFFLEVKRKLSISGKNQPIDKK